MARKTKVGWLVLGPDPHFAHCVRCGGTVAKPTLPASFEAVINYCHYAEELHRYCEEVPQPAPTPA